MDYQALFAKQNELDKKIAELHPPERGENRLHKKILALQVELAELAQEQRSWKFWSVDRKPRRNHLLEEYVDVLHFAISIAFDLGVTLKEVKVVDNSNRTIEERFMGLMTGYGILGQQIVEIDSSYHDLFANTIELGLALGLKLDDIEAAYYDKNKINEKRQDEGY